MTTVKVLQWDYREQPDLKALGEMIRNLSGGAVDLRPVPATGCDQYAVAVADHPLSDQEVQAAWTLRDEDYEDYEDELW